MSLLFVVPLVSGVWSSDRAQWLSIVQVKLPLLFLPLAMAGEWQLKLERRRLLILIYLLAAATSCAWSLTDYLVHRDAFHEAYLRAQTIRVAFDGDHVRFSWAVCIAMILAVMTASHMTGWKRVTSMVFAVAFFAYLHLLAARTGLLGAYLFLLAFLFYQLIKSRKKAVIAGTLSMLVLLPLFAWFCFPTFQNRFKYLRYDFDFVKNSQYLPGATDGNRLLSFKAGWNIIKENPVGVGAGDLQQEANAWYDRNVPGMLEADKVYPSNEWLVYGGFAGWPGILLLTVAMILPFFTRVNERFYYMCFLLTALLSFMVDTGLEVQYGVMLYALPACCWWKASAVSTPGIR